MSKAQLSPAQLAQADQVYAKGGFIARRKGQRRAKYFADLCDFYDQQGQAHETVANPVIAQVQFLGTFPGYDQYGRIINYRAHAITLRDGSRFAGYSRDGDQYVLCQHTGYLASK